MDDQVVTEAELLLSIEPGAAYVDPTAHVHPAARIGAGTVILRDVPPHALVVGNPARQIGWACGCGARLSRTLVCPDCRSKHRRVGTGLEKA